MAGIGVRLNRIYHKNTITTNIVGFFYSIVMTIAPVLVVILNLMLMQKVLKFNAVGYFDRELFSCTVLYIFIFSLLTTAPFNAVLSRYMSDVIFEDRYEDIRPCYRLGMLINISFSCSQTAIKTRFNTSRTSLFSIDKFLDIIYNISSISTFWNSTY